MFACGSAIRGRYTSDNGKTEQKVEMRDDEISNAITTVQKDSLVCEVRISPACGTTTEVICIDDTQGFDGVRIYKNFVPTLRSQRHGLKVLEVTNK